MYGSLREHIIFKDGMKWPDHNHRNTNKIWQSFFLKFVFIQYKENEAKVLFW
jgi:hypothetical protein